MTRALRGLAAVLTAVAMLTLGLVGGLTYLWCAPMGEARLHCCCPEEPGDAHHATVRTACCEARALSALPPGAAHTDVAPPVAPPALDLTWLASVEHSFLLVPVGEVTPLPDLRARAGPRRAVYSRCSVYLL